MTGAVRVAVAQFAPTEDPAQNLAAAADLVSTASEGADLVVLPEYSMITVPGMDARLLAAAQPLDGPFVRGLGEIAVQAGVCVVAGVVERTTDAGRFSNTLVAIGAQGSLLAVYRKLHLYDAFGYRESDLVRPGEIADPQTFTVGGLVFGMQTCYDLRFPEVTRRLVDAGCDAVAVPSQWVPGPLKEDHWATLLRARAIENTVYVVAADQAAPSGAGGSAIIDPIGVVIAGLGERTGSAGAALEPERLAEVRRRNPALALRRFSVVPRG